MRVKSEPVKKCVPQVSPGRQRKKETVWNNANIKRLWKLNKKLYSGLIADDLEEEFSIEKITNAFQGTEITVDDDDEDDLEACTVDEQRISHQ